MEVERASVEHFVEGLTKLADNVESIEYYEMEWRYAHHVNRETLGFEGIQKLPELTTWRAFIRDMIEELIAAREIGRRDFQVELSNCCRLEIALKTGFYHDDRQLLLDAIVELQMAASQVASLTTLPNREDEKPGGSRHEALMEHVHSLVCDGVRWGEMKDAVNEKGMF